MSTDDFNVILAELKKDISYIKTSIDDRFKLYDHKVEEFNKLTDKIGSSGERILKLELLIAELEKESEKRKDAILKVWIGVATAILIAGFNIITKKF